MASQSPISETDLEQTSLLGGLTRLNDKAHELDKYIERPHTEPTTLSSLPLELRELIYDHLFHDDTPQSFHDASTYGCQNFYLTTKEYSYTKLGCRCAQGLSQTNHFFSAETRERYFQNAIYFFSSPRDCQQFLDIGRITKDIKNLSIAYRNTLEQSALLRPIFNDLLSSTSLQSLTLHTTHSKGNPDDPPLYMIRGTPYGGRRAYFRGKGEADIYNCSLRPIKHPIGALLNIRKLVVYGQPIDELQEAIVHLTFKMDDLAKKEGNVLQTKGQWYGLEGEFFYERKIVHPFELEEYAPQEDGDEVEKVYDEDGHLLRQNVKSRCARHPSQYLPYWFSKWPCKECKLLYDSSKHNRV